MSSLLLCHMFSHQCLTCCSFLNFMYKHVHSIYLKHSAYLSQNVFVLNNCFLDCDHVTRAACYLQFNITSV